VIVAKGERRPVGMIDLPPQATESNSDTFSMPGGVRKMIERGKGGCREVQRWIS
jgi:hypothetical protein